MKNQRQRVVAIDYFRGVCILVVILSHSAAFSSPLAYLTGLGGLWTSAAEMFFLISGITFGIVRGEAIMSNFRMVLSKSLKRASLIYLLNMICVFISILMSYSFIAAGLKNYMAGALPQVGGFELLYNVAVLRYAFGWAGFLMFYCVFLVIAPFAMYTLKTRFWATVPLISVFLFMMNASPATHLSPYTSFAIWQLYFFIGLTLARFRVTLISRFYALPRSILKPATWLTLASAGLVILMSFLLAFNNGLYSVVYKLAREGWLPSKLSGAYSHLIDHRLGIDFWLGDSRYGALRPLATMIVFVAGYLLYQKYKEPLLRRTGYIVTSMGRDTLWIFVAQAMAIPLLAALPIKRNLINNLVLASVLFSSMWLITKRGRMLRFAKNYLSDVKLAYNSARYSARQTTSD